MSSPFSPIEVAWAGVDYKIEPDRVMGAIGRIEEVITLAEIHQMAAKGGAFQLVRIARAYGSVLRYAGARITDDEVYVGMFGASGMSMQEAMMTAITGLMSMMVPPSSLTATAPRINPLGGVRQGSRAPRSSKKPSRSPQVPAGS